MIYIRNCFQYFALFCLAIVFCQGCWGVASPNKPSSTPRKPSTNSNQEFTEKLDAQYSDNNPKVDLKIYENDNKKQQTKALAQQLLSRSAPSQPATPTTSQDTGQENLKKALEAYEEGKQQTIAQNTAIWRQMGVPDDQIKELVKIANDANSKLEAKLFELPYKQQEDLSAAITIEASLQKEIQETDKQLQNLLIKHDLKQLKIEDEISQPFLQKLVEVFQEAYKFEQDSIDPEDHISLNNLDAMQDSNMNYLRVIQAAYLECSAEDQQAYRTSLSTLLQLLESRLQETKVAKKLIPDSLVKLIKETTLEIYNKQAQVLKQIPELINKDQ